MTLPAPASVEELLREPSIWRPGRGDGAGAAGTATGIEGLDERLSGGGWPRGAMTEVLTDQEGIGELRILVPALARLCAQGHWLAWIDPPYLPYPPALAAHGIDLSRVLLVNTSRPAEGWWAAEQALRAGSCGAVLLWDGAGALSAGGVRRLQLAAEAGNALGVLFRRAGEAGQASAAALRVQLRREDGTLMLHVLKCRGAAPGVLPVAGLEPGPLAG